MVRMMPAITAAARMMFAGILRVMGGAMYPPMKQPMHSMMAAGQSTAPWMMNTTEALMFAPVPIRVFNALKTLIGTGANISASVVFIIQGAVDWPAAIMLCIGCFIGGYIAPPITRKIPANIMRAAAVIAGIILTIDLGLKTY